MRPKRVLVTGISGNVGYAIAAALAAAGFEIVGVVRTTMPAGLKFRMVFADLDQPDALAGEVAKADAIVHCASPRTKERARVLREIAAMGRMLDAWQGGPFVYLSSQVVYGVPKGILDERMSLEAEHWYDLGKIANELQLDMSARAAPGLRTGISLRLPLLYGAGPRRRDRQFLPAIYDGLLAGHTFRFADETLAERAGSVFIGERDLGAAVEAALLHGKTGPYNLQSGFCTWKTLIEEMARRAGVVPKFKIGRGRALEPDEHWLIPSRSEYDCTKFEADTGFEPRQTIGELLDLFVAAEQSRGRPG